MTDSVCVDETDLIAKLDIINGVKTQTRTAVLQLRLMKIGLHTYTLCCGAHVGNVSSNLPCDAS